MSRVNLLATELRVGRRSALNKLRKALVEHDGSVRATALRLGISTSALYGIARSNPQVAKILSEHSMGRVGAVACARRVRFGAALELESDR